MLGSHGEDRLKILTKIIGDMQSSVGNMELYIPYSVGKTCPKHISQHPSLGSGESATPRIENRDELE